MYVWMNFVAREMIARRSSSSACAIIDSLVVMNDCLGSGNPDRFLEWQCPRMQEWGKVVAADDG